MKFLIASDLHGSAHYCQLLKDRIEEEAVDKVILLGDLLYHGARNALPLDYSTLKTAEILNSIKEKLICVKGNCDSEVDSLVLEFPLEAQLCVLPLKCGRTALFTHGHRIPVCLGKRDVLICGHFHVPAFEEREMYTYVNCGSVSIPKQNSPNSYLLLKDSSLIWKKVESGEIFMTKNL